MLKPLMFWQGDTQELVMPFIMEDLLILPGTKNGEKTEEDNA
jgi:hypothetical protein